MTSDTHICKIKSDITIKSYLLRRFHENGVSFINVVKDAQKNGVKISPSQLCRYINSKSQPKFGLKQSDVLWLCKRWGIDVAVSAIYNNNFTDNDCC